MFFLFIYTANSELSSKMREGAQEWGTVKANKDMWEELSGKAEDENKARQEMRLLPENRKALANATVNKMMGMVSFQLRFTY